MKELDKLYLKTLDEDELLQLVKKMLLSYKGFLENLTSILKCDVEN